MIKENNSTTGDITDYLYGDDLIKQTKAANDSYYLYDGLGSTRALSNGIGLISDTYDYSSFGKTLNQTGSTENHYLFTGEQFDLGLDSYYLRARYYNQNNGRFTQQDTWIGDNSNPLTLHKYLYANVDPVNNIDPTGRFTLAEFSVGSGIAFGLVLTATPNYSGITGGGEWGGSSDLTNHQLGMAKLLTNATGVALEKLTKIVTHGNSKKSTKKHHVYEIWDNSKYDVFKYGISGGVLNLNGRSRRANNQVNAFNSAVGWARYSATVLFKNIPGRIRALAIEQGLVNRYARSHNGKGPPGNLRPVPKL